MELSKNVYGTLQRFKANYLIDFTEQDEHNNILPYLRNRLDFYNSILDRVEQDQKAVLAEMPQSSDTHKRLTSLNNIFENLFQIVQFIQIEIEREKAVLMDRKNRLKAVEVEEPPLTKTQKQAVGLLIEAGVIEFLRTKFNGNNSQIGKFVETITKEQIKYKNVSNGITDEHRDYANNFQDKKDTQLRLRTIFPKYNP